MKDTRIKKIKNLQWLEKMVNQINDIVWWYELPKTISENPKTLLIQPDTYCI